MKSWQEYLNITIKKPLNVVVFISGRGSNLEAIVQDNSCKILGVISDKQEATGLELAKKNNIPIFLLSGKGIVFEESIKKVLSEINFDLIVLAGFMRIVPTSIIKNFPFRIINIHPSLLPAFKGINAQKQALNSGAKFAGCSVHFVNEELDAGAIIAQAVVAIEEKDSEETLTAKILKEEHLLLPKVVKAIGEGRLYFDGTWWVRS